MSARRNVRSSESALNESRRDVHRARGPQKIAASRGFISGRLHRRERSAMFDA
jgi:hypothetical protein